MSVVYVHVVKAPCKALMNQSQYLEVRLECGAERRVGNVPPQLKFVTEYFCPFLSLQLFLHSRLVGGLTMPNPALNLAPFGRWTALKRRRLALLQGLPQIYN